MKKVFVDTNVVLDLLGKRDPFFYEAAKLFSLGDKKLIQLSASALTIANASYVLRKRLTLSEIRETLNELTMMLKILPLDAFAINQAISNKQFADFEDGLQFYVAQQHQQEIIITRNLKDFTQSSIYAMTAGQYLEMFESKT